ncbi:MAG: aminotransferase class IV [Dehalococcoidia bacterium]|nr:aminotransferase class IV [Dehalococcoidia bacterium]
MADEKIVYFNGEFLPEDQVGISIYDRGFLYGDAVFDATRTFAGQTFRLDRHINRLYDSLRYLRIDVDMSKAEMTEATEAVVAHNHPLLPAGQDMWVMQRISRGVEAPNRAGGLTPTILIESHAIPFAARAPLYRDGARISTPSVPRIPPRFVSPRAKTHNYLNLILGELEAHGEDPGTWAILLDEFGNLTEGRGSNIFVVKDGVAMTPKSQYVLEGVTRNQTLELAAGLGIPTAECDLDLYDAYTADEAFLTSTSLCICPVSGVNGAPVADGVVPGPVTHQLMTAFSDLVGMDFAEQYLAHLP